MGKRRESYLKAKRDAKRNESLRNSSAQSHLQKNSKNASGSDSSISRKGLDKFYHDNYKQLLLIPFLLLVASLIVIGVHYVQTGSLVDTGVSLSGGLTLTIPTDGTVDKNALESSLKNTFENDFLVREIAEFGTQQAITIQAAPINLNDDLDVLEKTLVASIEEFIPDASDTYTVEIVGPSLGKTFLQQTLIALVVAFVFMSLVVFYYFRTFVPSFAVILAAFSDIVITLAVIILLEVKLSTAGIAAFLMLIGYSVDTDILLSTRVLKNTVGSVYERIKGAISTGMLMNITTLAAVSVSLLVTQSEVIQQIMLILLIGLLADIINTWIQNAGILRWYMEGRE